MLAAFLNLTDQTALVVGGGHVAARRVERLRAAGMLVRVVAPNILPPIGQWASSLHERPFEPHDLEDVALVVACTNDSALNDHIAALALERGVLVNHAGNAAAGNMVFPALWEQGGVSVAIHTAPSLPMLSKALCTELSRRYPAPWPVEQWGQQRQKALSLSADGRKQALSALKKEIEQVVIA